MTVALWKNTFREIWNTKGRFLSILAIIGLGVGFFASVKGTAPCMTATAEQYYSQYNLMDLRLVSSVGFDNKDIKAIKNTNGISDAQGGYMADVIVNNNNEAEVYRLHSLSKGDNPINCIDVIEGRLPEKSGEIILENYRAKNLDIGDKIKIEDKAGDANTSSMLKKNEYTIVGLGNSPMYVSSDRGTSNIGSGDIARYGYILPEDFAYERYTEVYVTAKCSQDGISPFSDEYKKNIEELSKQVENLGEQRIQVFTKETINPAKKELEENKKKYKQEKNLAQKKLNDAQKKLKEGEKTLKEESEKAQKALDEAEKQLNQGETLLPYSITSFYEEIMLAQQKISDSKLQLAQGKSDLAIAKNSYETQTTAARVQLENAQKEYDSAYKEFYEVTKPEAEAKINTYSALIERAKSAINKIENSDYPLTDDMKETLNQLKITLTDYETQLQDGYNRLAEGEQQLKDAKIRLDSGKAELETQMRIGKEKIDSAQSQISEAEKQIEYGQRQLDEATKNGREELNNARAQITEGKVKLESGKIKLDTEQTIGKNKLSSGQQELEIQKKKAEDEFRKAKSKLDYAENQLAALSSPKWHIMNRNDYEGYKSFSSTADSMDAIASIFPLFFLIVAVLVCLTTMTRLLEERRTEIGTLKALGYSSASITFKYIVYAVTAGLIGCVIGIAITVPIIPNVIFNAYRMMYKMPSLVMQIPWLYIGEGIGAAILCSTGVVLFVCRKSLGKTPAKLMRPKAPKPGKRILLERIKPLWSHLGFTSKVTARNLFRYKTRLLMTILGVAGCTALIVTAFGIKNAVNTVVDKQFTEVYKINGMIVPNKAGDASDLEELCNFIKDYKGIKNVLPIDYQQCTVEVNGENENISIYTPESVSEMKEMIDLHTRQDHKNVPLTNNGAVITEKLSRVTGLGIGDEITYKYNDKNYTAKITGICENYVGHYIYMTPDYYRELYGKDPKFNLIIQSSEEMTEQEEETLANLLLQRDDVLTSSFISSSVKSVKNIMENINIIVYVMIIFAAVLAFVVLYNLTNINIAERKREIATIKVLGFYNLEVGEYIYRENIILTILGIFAGLIMGVFLNGFIIETAEMSDLMFGRDVGIMSFIYAIGLTALFAFTVNFFMYFKMKFISMVESLKSIE